MADADVVSKNSDSHESTKDKKLKDRKKKGKNALIDDVKKSIAELPMDKQVENLLSRFGELADENRNLQQGLKNAEKMAQQAQKDKEKVDSEHAKAVLSRSRLESLCRELHKQNKLIKDLNTAKITEEEERRKEITSRFNTNLSEISNLMEANSESNSKVREENQRMAERLQELSIQHEKREIYFEKVMKQREIEAQLYETKMKKSEIEFVQCKEKALLDRKALLQELAKSHESLDIKAQTEIALRSQLTTYAEKYEELQTLFTTFKKEIDDRSNIMKLQQKEVNAWKKKFDDANTSLYQMFNDRTKMEATIEAKDKQNAQLQSLCRALQQQTRDLRAQMKTLVLGNASNFTSTNAQNSEPDYSHSSSSSGKSTPVEKCRSPVLKNCPCKSKSPSPCPTAALSSYGSCQEEKNSSFRGSNVGFVERGPSLVPGNDSSSTKIGKSSSGEISKDPVAEKNSSLGKTENVSPRKSSGTSSPELRSPSDISEDDIISTFVNVDSICLSDSESENFCDENQGKFEEIQDKFEETQNKFAESQEKFEEKEESSKEVQENLYNLENIKSSATYTECSFTINAKDISLTQKEEVENFTSPVKVAENKEVGSFTSPANFAENVEVENFTSPAKVIGSDEFVINFSSSSKIGENDIDLSSEKLVFDKSKNSNDSPSIEMGENVSPVKNGENLSPIKLGENVSPVKMGECRGNITCSPKKILSGKCGDVSPIKIDASSELSSTKIDISGELSPTKIGIRGELSPKITNSSSELPPTKIDISGELSPKKTNSSSELSPTKFGVSEELPPTKVGASGELPPTKIGASVEFPPTKYMVSENGLCGISLDSSVSMDDSSTDG